MGVVYGLLAALLWGTADFFARLAAERVGSRSTAFYMQCVALVCASALLGAPGTWPAHPTSAAVALACIIGVTNAVGAALLYRALEIGTVSLVSPVSSTFAALTATLAIAAGERPTRMQVAGLAVTVVGVVLVSVPIVPSRGPRASTRGVGLAVAAAMTWGLGFFLLRYVVRDLGSVLPVWISRWMSILALGGAALATKRRLPSPRGAVWPIVGVAVFDSGAFIFYNLGLATHLTAVVSVISSLFSAVTVLLAFVFLRERLARSQWGAIAIIFAGLSLVSAAG